jgi:hypothetical protein
VTITSARVRRLQAKTRTVAPTDAEREEWAEHGFTGIKIIFVQSDPDTGLDFCDPAALADFLLEFNSRPGFKGVGVFYGGDPAKYEPVPPGFFRSDKRPLLGAGET